MYFSILFDRFSLDLFINCPSKTEKNEKEKRNLDYYSTFNLHSKKDEQRKLSKLTGFFILQKIYCFSTV